jgi:hypothetical protein
MGSFQKQREKRGQTIRRELIEKLGGKMPEEAVGDGVSIKLEDKEAKMLEKALNNKSSWDQQEKNCIQMLNQIHGEQSKAQGKIDGAIELITEVNGYEYDKVGAYSVDTTAKFLVVSFKKESPEADTADQPKPSLAGTLPAGEALPHNKERGAGEPEHLHPEITEDKKEEPAPEETKVG